MTTTVTVKAHCTSDKEVVIENSELGLITLQDGEVYETVVFDDRSVTVKEVFKAQDPQVKA